MSVYTLEDVIKECTNKYDAKGTTLGAKNEIYQGTWSALNAWIETKLAKQKVSDEKSIKSPSRLNNMSRFFVIQGAGVSGLGCFGWEIKQKNGSTSCRPIFVISDTFVKNFQVRKDRVFRLPRTTPIEQLNTSMLAIKFSKALTKDMVFIGIRDLVKKIGDFIYRGCELELEFSFGKLLAKERRVRFEFNQVKLAQVVKVFLVTILSHLVNSFCSSLFPRSIHPSLLVSLFRLSPDPPRVR